MTCHLRESNPNSIHDFGSKGVHQVGLKREVTWGAWVVQNYSLRKPEVHYDSSMEGMRLQKILSQNVCLAHRVIWLLKPDLKPQPHPIKSPQFSRLERSLHNVGSDPIPSQDLNLILAMDLALRGLSGVGILLSQNHYFCLKRMK